MTRPWRIFRVALPIVATRCLSEGPHIFERVGPTSSRAEIPCGAISSTSARIAIAAERTRTEIGV